MSVEKLYITICWLLFITSPLLISCLENNSPCDSDLQCVGGTVELKCCEGQCRMECSEDKSQTKEVQIDSGAQESTESHKPDPPKVETADSTPTTVKDESSKPASSEPAENTGGQKITGSDPSSTDQAAISAPMVKNAQTLTDVNAAETKQSTVGESQVESVESQPPKQDDAATVTEPKSGDTRTEKTEPKNDKTETEVTESTVKQSQAESHVEESSSVKDIKVPQSAVASVGFKISATKPEATDVAATVEGETTFNLNNKPAKTETTDLDKIKDKTTAVSEDEFQPGGGQLFDDKEWNALFGDLDLNYWDNPDYDYEDDKFFDYYDAPDYEDKEDDDKEDEDKKDDDTNDEENDDSDNKVPADNSWDYDDYDYWMKLPDDYEDYQDAYDYAMQWYEENIEKGKHDDDDSEIGDFGGEMVTTVSFYHWAFLGLVASVVIVMFYIVLRFFFDYNIFGSKSASGWATLQNEEERLYSNANYVNLGKEA